MGLYGNVRRENFYDNSILSVTKIENDLQLMSKYFYDNSILSVTKMRREAGDSGDSFYDNSILSVTKIVKSQRILQ